MYTLESEIGNWELGIWNLDSTPTLMPEYSLARSLNLTRDKNRQTKHMSNADDPKRSLESVSFNAAPCYPTGEMCEKRVAFVMVALLLAVSTPSA